MIGEVLLDKGGRIKLLRYIADAAVGADFNFKNFWIVIDISKKVMTFSNHINVESGMFVTYEWPILQTNFDQTQNYEVPAKGLMNILDKFDNDKPIWFIFESESRLSVAEYVERDSQQPSLFGIEELEITQEQFCGIKYGVQLKSQFTADHYRLDSHPADISFQISAVELCSVLKLAEDLYKESNGHHMTRELQFVANQNPEHQQALTVYAEKGSWCSALTIPVEGAIQSSSGNLLTAAVDIKKLSKIKGLLSKVSGLVSVRITPSHLIFTKPHWLCSFRLTEPTWNGVSTMRGWMIKPSEHYIALKTDLLTYILPKLNVADEKNKARLLFKRGPTDSYLHLGIDQDHVFSDIDIKLGVNLLSGANAMSLSLWSLNILLDYFGSQIYWFYEPGCNGVLITNHARKAHILLFGDQKGG